MAITKFDQFDFLIDIVPREELKPAKRQDEVRTSVLPDQIQYYLQLAQQQAQQSVSTAQTQATTPITNTVVPQQATQIQLPGGQILQPPFQIQTAQTTTAAATTPAPAQQVITVQPQQQTTITAQPQVQQIQQVQQVQQIQPPQTQTQVFQQVITPSGEVQNVPIQLTPAQLQAIQMQLQGKGNQPIIIQTPATQTQTATQADQNNVFANQSVFQVQQLAGSGQQVFIQENEETDQS